MRERRSLGWWNGRLLDHYFGANSGRGPVSQLLVTDLELARVFGLANANPETAAASLLDAVKRRLEGTQKRTTFMGQAAALDEPPDRLAYLIVTCFAASSCDEETVRMNDFRNRLESLLGEAPGPLQKLPNLWESLAAWLALQRRNGKALRTLQLPDCPKSGHDSQIGYSKRLAFPSHRDARALNDVLSACGVVHSEPPIFLVTEQIAKNRSRFTTRFQEALDAFLRVRGSASPEELAQTEFWSAVRQAATWEAPVRPGTESDGVATRFQCFLSLDDEDELELFLAADADRLPQEENWQGLACKRTDLVEGFPYLVIAEDRCQTRPTDEPVRRLLSGEIALPELQALCRDGFLLFDASEWGYMPLLRDKPEDVDLHAFVREERRELAQTLTTDVRLSERYPGWLEARRLDPVKVAATSLDQERLPRCLQDVARPSRIRFERPVRLLDAFLGFREILPGIRAGLATRLVARIGERVVELQQDPEGSWQFPREAIEDLDGEVDFVAFALAQDGEEYRLADTRVRFRTSTDLCRDYGSPSRPNEWRIEAGSVKHRRPTRLLEEGTGDEVETRAADFSKWLRGEVLYLGPRVGDVSLKPRPGFDWEAFKEAEDGDWFVVFRGDPNAPAQPEAKRAKRATDGNRNLRLWKTIVTKGRVDRLSVADRQHFASYRRMVRRSGEYPVVSSDLAQIPTAPASTEAVSGRRTWHSHAAAERLEMILAGRLRSAAGVPQHVVLSLIEEVFELPSRSPLVWEIHRAWVESGCFDDCLKVTWRDRRVFANAPKLVAHRANRKICATLMGLTTDTFRGDLENEAGKHGVDVSQRSSVSRWGPGTLRFEADDDAPISELSSACGLGQLYWCPPVSAEVTSLEEVAAACPSSRRPTPFERTRGWDWRRGGFFRGFDGTEGRPRIDCYERADSPVHFAVEAAGRDPLWTHSRNWALLLGYRAAGVQPFESCERDEIVRAVQGALYLPLPLARLAFVLGPRGSGPRGDGLSTKYVYTFPSTQLRDHVLKTLYGEQ